MMSQEIKDFFIEEAEELFDSLHSILLKNEELGTISKEEIDSIFRDIHTLKGGAGSVEMTKFSDYAHHLETFMDLVKSGEITLNSNIIDFLIESVSQMQTLLHQEHTESIDEETYEKNLQKLLDDIEKVKQADFHPITETNNSVSTENAAELIDLFDSLTTIVNNVKNKQIHPNVAIADIFRLVHTLKGASQFLNLKYFPRYIHEVESLLDSTRSGKVDYDETFNNFMESFIEHSKTLVEHELNHNINSETFDEQLIELQEELKRLFSNESNSEEEIINKEAPAFELFDIPTSLAPPTSLLKENVQNRQEDTKQDITLNKAASTSIRVNLDKIDQLMNRVGDLVITKSMLFQFAETVKDDAVHKAIFEKLSDLDRDIRELQESVMSVRMVPMENVYSRLPKMVRDLAKKLDKKIKFDHIGDSVEIDKMMVEGLMDPLTHIIRNSLDHGIESPKERYQKGKPEVGKLVISAVQESGNIIISIRDDGAGIDVKKVSQKALESGAVTQEELSRMSEQDKLMLIFHPGLSTAEKVTSVSGRGVGMDVVMNNISTLGGYIKVLSTPDKGSEFQIILPLTLAILDGLNVMIGDKKLILPLNTIVESLQPKTHMIKHIGEGDKELLMLRDEFIPIIRLYDFFHITPTYTNLEEGMLIIIKTASTKAALFVDDFLNQEQIVVKSLEKNYKKIQGIGAATIRGDGSIGLILDVVNIIELEHNKER